jgi:hypothetical protein
MALGAAAVVTVGFVGVSASSMDAQTASDPIRSELVSVDDTGARHTLPSDVVSAISDTGDVVVYDTAVSEAGIDPAINIDPPTTADPVATTVDPVATVDSSAEMSEGRRVWIRDRIGNFSRAVAEDRSVAPGVSGNGCIVAYTVLSAVDATLTVVDRCATSIELPLPIGTILDTVTLDTAQVAPPSLSFDGSTIVWSTGREIRRYIRAVDGGQYVRSHNFDVVPGGSPDVVTGIQTDVSADGGAVVFVAGPGTSPFEPTPANVYVWSSATPQLEPELISATSSGDAGVGDSSSPTISADGSFVVFESTSPELSAVVSASPELAEVGESSPIVPFVVGVDRVANTGEILVDDASRPAVSGDGNHVVYQRGDAVRVLSSDATSTIDHGIDELADARPSGGVQISQHGRWLVFSAPTDPVNAPADGTPQARPTSPDSRAAVWAVDRTSSNTDVLDTTTTTSTTTTTTTTPPPTSSATTSRPIVTAPRAPTVVAPRPPAVSVSASPVTFDPTVIGVARRVESVILSNTGSRETEVVSASVDGPAAYTVVSDDCSGSPLAAGTSCAVGVEFAPSTAGPVSGTLTFRLIDGSTVAAALDGEGVPEPTLDLVPAVAGTGQTVTAFGVGFPSGSTVELVRPGSATPEPIVVDDDGTFAHVIVVLPHTPAGSTQVRVSGQPDAFNDVTSELVVSGRRPTSADAALRGRVTSLFGR